MDWNVLIVTTVLCSYITELEQNKTKKNPPKNSNKTIKDYTQNLADFYTTDMLNITNITIALVNKTTQK